MKFEKFAIAEELKENLIANRYFRTTDIQYKVIPAALNQEDILAIAQTGTGKTAAFAIPVIHNIHSFKSSKRSRFIQCLVMVPTRELAKQIGDVFSRLCKHTKASCYAIYGGVEQEKQMQQLEGGVDILVATPGRMFDLIRQKVIDISSVNMLVLDEADRMLDLGFIEDIKSIKRLLTRKHQTLFFSATINPKIKKLAYSLISSKALHIQVSPEKMVSKNITHSLVKVKMDEKRNLLVNFAQSNCEIKCIVFVRTQVRVDRLVTHLLKNDLNVFTVHGGMDQTERENNLNEFRNKPSGFLIATDVTARGIDLPGISHVINYDLPDDPENYIHRIGRTGRGFAKGEAISFCAPEENEKLIKIEEFLHTKIVEQKVDKQFKLPERRMTDQMSISEMIAMEEAIFQRPKRTKKKASGKGS